MIFKKSITVFVPSELLYAFDPDHEHEFVLSRERGLIVARPVVEVTAGSSVLREEKSLNLPVSNLCV